MNFRINPEKALEVCARITGNSGGQVEYLRLIKLVYLADREAILKLGRPIVGGRYWSMPLGPTIGEVMDLAKERLFHSWKSFLSEPENGRNIRLLNSHQLDNLSEKEVEIIDSVVSFHKTRTTGGLVKWCHENCGEYEEVKSGRKSIRAEAILEKEGVSPERVSKFIERSESHEELAVLLS